MSYYAYEAKSLGPYQVDPLNHLGLAYSIAKRFKCHHLGRRDIEQEALAALCAAARTYDPNKGTFGTWATSIITSHLKGVQKVFHRVGGIGSRNYSFLPKPFVRHLLDGGSRDPEVLRPLLKNRWWTDPTDWDCLVAATFAVCPEVSLNILVRSDNSRNPSSTHSLLDTIEDEGSLGEVTRPLVEQEFQRVIRAALEKMSVKEQEVAVRRLLEVLDDPPTLQEIGDTWGVSRERVRQVESKARGVLLKWLGEDLVG
jgi:RNA polymerase sigma factor (sigma-70 family)